MKIVKGKTTRSLVPMIISYRREMMTHSIWVAWSTAKVMIESCSLAFYFRDWRKMKMMKRRKSIQRISACLAKTSMNIVEGKLSMGMVSKTIPKHKNVSQTNWVYIIKVFCSLKYIFMTQLIRINFIIRIQCVFGRLS